MANDKKKVAALIVAGMPAPGKLKKAPEGAMNNDGDRQDGDMNDDDEVGGEDTAQQSAFGDFRAAIKKGDDKAGAEALHEFLNICGYKRHAE